VVEEVASSLKELEMPRTILKGVTNRWAFKYDWKENRFGGEI